MTRTRTVFLGTGAFAVPIVATLNDDPAIELVGVVTARTRPGSRGRMTPPPVGAWASENGIGALTPARLRTPEAIAELEALRPDLLVLADYGQIVPGSLLDVPRHGALNLHPSLLPRHRGATPIPAAILAGDQETGVTLMRMDEGLDTGPVIAQWRTPLSGNETAPELESALSSQAARLLKATLEHWIAGEIRPDPQPDSGSTLTRPLRRADGEIDAAKPALELERQVRAYQPWPGSFLETKGGRMIVWSAHTVTDAPMAVPAGQLTRHDAGIALVTSNGLLALDEVQPAGGRRMTSAELLRGRPDFVA